MNNFRNVFGTAMLAAWLVMISCATGLAQLETPYERSGGTQSATYAEVMDFYTQLKATSPKVRIEEYGTTDIGEPLNLVIIADEELKAVKPDYLKRTGKLIMLVNNGIHAGESCGVDASMMLAREVATNRKYEPLLENCVLVLIPFYNIGGALNRGCCSRTNQQGPEEHGFRGNARVLDLNRDFIKCDSRNAKSFNKIISAWRPHLFFDTHTTNGADYPAVMTLIPNQQNKATPAIGDYMEDLHTPALYESMEKAGIIMCPYVNSVAQVPDSGISDFLDLPRYSTGYVNLFNVAGYTTEAHMLKTFKERVDATYTLLLGALKTMNRDQVQIKRKRKEADEMVKTQETFPIRWKLNKEVERRLKFKGYAAKYKPSEVTGMDRLYYDRNEPWEKEIPLFNQYDTEVEVKKPVAYIIPQAWRQVINRLKWNGVKMKPLTENMNLEVEMYYIEDYKDVRGPWEGHYAHYDTKVRTETQNIEFRKGDYVIFVDQVVNRYIVETLEPEAHDSYFNWNFFDEILGRKEYFSPYVFEDEAAEMLKADANLKAEFEEARQDSAFAASQWAQLDFIYQRSKHFEPTYRRYPVGRLMKKTKLKLSSR